MSNIKLDVRVYPIDEPKGNTLAFANVGVEDLVAINGIRVVNGEKGLFVAMPQSKDKNGEYHDIAFPINGELRKDMNKAVLGAYKELTAEKKQSLDDLLNDGKEKAAEYSAQRAAQPQAAYAKKSPGLGD
jgi:stage V sporulation protein G